jgi:cell division protein FtsW (lipid II flippase)
LLEVLGIAFLGFLLTFSAAVANQLGHGNTHGIMISQYINLGLLLLWILFAIFIPNRLWDAMLLLPLTIVNGILWARALHSCNGAMDPIGPQRVPR